MPMVSEIKNQRRVESGPRERIQVRVSPITKERIAPIYGDRKAFKHILRVAERLGQNEALELCKSEETVPYELKSIGLRPSEELKRRADLLNLPPHILVRAAAIKIAADLERGVDPKLAGLDRDFAEQVDI